MNNPHAKGYTSEGSSEFERLIVSMDGYHAKKGVLVTDAAHDLKRGALLGYVTASGKYTLYDSGGAGGAEVGDAILAEDANATAADVEVEVIDAGNMSSTEIIAQTAGLASISRALEEELRAKNIILNTTLQA